MSHRSVKRKVKFVDTDLDYI